MGFSDLGRTINNNNERLRKNIREKYFRSPAASDKDDSGNQHYIYIDPLTTKTSNRSMWIIPLVMVGLIFMGGFFVVHWLETIVKKSNLAYEHNLETLREQADYNRVVRGYQILTEEGFRFLDKHQYGDAMRSFAQALNLRQNGHSANYGITKTLIYQCVKKGEFCSEADKYYKTLQNAGVYQQSELKILRELRAGS